MERFRNGLFFIIRQAAYGSLFLFTLLLLALYTLRFPVIQNRLLPYVKSNLEASLGTRVDIGSVEIALWDYLIIRDFVMYDTRGEKFISARKVKLSLIDTSIPGWLGAVGSKKYLTIRDIELDEGYFNLYRRTDDLKLNMFFLSGNKPDTTDSEMPDIRIRADHIRLFNSSFNYIDSAKGPTRLQNRDYLNFIHLMLDSIYGDISFELKPRGEMKAHIRNLSARDTWSGFALDTFKTRFSSGLSVQDKAYQVYDKAKDSMITYQCYEELPYVYLDQTYIKSMGSRIDADLRLPGQTLGALFDDQLQEDWKGIFRPSLVDFRFVNSFSSYKLPFAEPVLFSGKVSGEVNNLRGQEVHLKLKDSTYLDASIQFHHLVEGGETRMELEIPESRLMAREIQAFIPTIPIPLYFMNATDIRMKGSYSGLFSDFVARSEILSPHGELEVDLHLDLKQSPIIWSGSGKAQSFDLNQILGKEANISSNLNFTSEFSGKGDNLSDLTGEAKIYMVQSELSGYSFDSIWSSLTIVDGKLTGPLDVKDSDLGNLHVQTAIDFGSPILSYDVLGDVQRINLQSFGLSELPLFFSSVVNLHMEGDSLDALEGVVRLFETQIHKRGIDTLKINQFLARAEIDSTKGRLIKIRTEALDLDLNMDVSYLKASSIFSRVIEESALFFKNNDSLTQAYYQVQLKDTIPTRFKAEASIYEMNEMLAFFETGIYIAPNTTLALDLKTGHTDIIRFSLNSPEMRYESYQTKGVKLEGSVFKATGSGEILAQADLFVSGFKAGEDVSFQNIRFEPVWYNETIDFELEAKQEAFQNNIRIFGNSVFQKGQIKTVIGSNNSALLLNQDKWTFQGKNEVIYYSSTGTIQLNDVHLKDSSLQSVHLYGDISREPTEGLIIKADNVKLTTLNQLAGTGTELEGKLNAQIMLNDLYDEPYMQGFAFIKGFGFREFQYGDIEANAIWNQSSKTLSLDCALQSGGKKLLAMTGQYNTLDTVSPINFKLASYDLPLQLAEPFMDGFVYDVKGTVELNEFNARGTFSKPVITGTGYFKDVSFMVDYTKTRYNFTGNIRFNDRNINFLDIRLFDERSVNNKQNFALLTGYIHHDGFRDFKFNVELESIRNFMVFNTKEADNDLFYGKMIIREGMASIDGDLNTIRLTTFVETGAGTVLNIPLLDYTEGSTLDFVDFISDQIEEEVKEKLDLTGFELVISVSATPDATVRIIFDDRTGEIIEAQGNGTIDLKVTPEGEFTMRGSYEIEKGDYLFTLQNGAFNKRFFIDKGGRIVWTGSPYEAQLDLNAYYLVYANIADLMGPTASASRVPVRVLMKMNGSLLSPEIALNLDVQSLNDQSAAEVSSRIKAITSDPQQLNNQVFFLLMSSRFAPNMGGNTAGGGSGAGGVTSSVAELVSNQLNYWTSQAFGNNFSANISSNQFQNVNLALQAKLFNDRVTVERNGAITSSANSDVTIGNINVQLKLLPPTRNREGRRKRLPNPGMLALEAFNREQFGFSGNNSVSRGGGIFYRKDFDRLGELIFPFKPGISAPPPPPSQTTIDQDSIR